MKRAILIIVLAASAPVLGIAKGSHPPAHMGWHHRLAGDERSEEPQRSDDRWIYDKDGHYRGYEDSHGNIYDEDGHYSGYEYGPKV